MQDDPASGSPFPDDQRRTSIDPPLQRILFIAGLVLAVVSVLMGLPIHHMVPFAVFQSLSFCAF